MVKTNKCFALLLAVLLLSLNACKTSDDASPPPIVPQKPVINSFTADATDIASFTSVVLTWSVANANTAVIDNGIGTVSASGSLTVYPKATTTYTLTATNDNGGVSAQVNVAVKVLLNSIGRQYNKEYKYCFIGGTMKNLSNYTIYDVLLDFSVYNTANTAIIEISRARPANGGMIDPGETEEYKAYLTKVTAWDQAGKITLTASWQSILGVRGSVTETIY